VAGLTYAQAWALYQIAIAGAEASLTAVDGSGMGIIGLVLPL
jgi:hypothetical protein